MSLFEGLPTMIRRCAVATSISIGLFGLSAAPRRAAAEQIGLPVYDITDNCLRFSDPVDTIYVSREISRRKCDAQERSSRQYLDGTWDAISASIKQVCLHRPQRSLSYRYSVLAVCVKQHLKDERLAYPR